MTDVLHGVGEISEGVGARQAAELSPLVVAGHAVVAALLDQLGGQVQTEPCGRNAHGTLINQGKASTLIRSTQAAWAESGDYRARPHESRPHVHTRLHTLFRNS